jgi:hypothetical protein
MIYKINDQNLKNSLELTQIDENALSIQITSLEDETFQEIVIDNSRLYKLLGALHFLQKEMPLFNPNKKY